MPTAVAGWMPNSTMSSGVSNLHRHVRVSNNVRSKWFQAEWKGCYSAATSPRSALSTTIGVSQSCRSGGAAQRLVTVATQSGV